MRILACLVLILSSQSAIGKTVPKADRLARADLFVSPLGSDRWSGALAAPNRDGTDGPLASLVEAQKAVRTMRRHKPGLARPLVVMLRGGTYELAVPLALEPADGGTAKSPTVWAGYPGERAVISGGRKIGGWIRNAKGWWETRLQLPGGGPWQGQSLFVNGQRRLRPRSPRDGYNFIASSLPSATQWKDRGSDRFRYFEGDIPDPEGLLRDGEVVVIHVWSASRLRPSMVLPDSRTLVFTGPTFSAADYGSMSRGRRWFVDNARESLGEPGRFYYDRDASLLTYVPLPGEELDSSEVVMPWIRSLLEFRGKLEKGGALANIEFRDLEFACSGWALPPEGWSFSQAEAGIPAAIPAVGTRNAAFRRVTVRGTGGYAFEFGPGCRDILVDQCVLTDLGAGGVKIGSFDLMPDDKAASRITVRDTTIAHGGRTHPAAVGVWIGHSAYNRIEHNDIFDFYYTGVSVGWSWGYGPSGAHHNEVLYNHIHDLGHGVLSDMGGIYTLGLSPGSVLRGNVIHDVDSFDYGGWGVYLDEGTTGMLVEDNLVYRTKSGGFHQHYGRDNVVRNNIFAFARRDGQVIRTRSEPHHSFTFTRNIVMWRDAPLLGSNWSGTGYEIDRNVYWNTAGKPAGPRPDIPWAEWREMGHDLKSVVADPRFRDPLKDDFRLKAGSPALKVGFKPFDPRKAGRRNPPAVPVADVAQSFVPGAAVALPVREDFEFALVGDKTMDAVTWEDAEKGTARVTSAAAASGKQSLMFSEVADAPHNYNPHVYWEPGYTSGTLVGRFAVRLEPGAVFEHEWRDWRGGNYQSGPSLRVNAEGELSADGRALMKLPAGEWIRFEVRYTMGTAGPWDLKVRTGSAEKSWTDLKVSAPLGALTWFGFVSAGTKPGTAFYLDDVELAPAGTPSGRL